MKTFYLVTNVGFGKLEELEVSQIKDLQFLYSINLADEGINGADGYECRVYHLINPTGNSKIPWLKAFSRLSVVVVQTEISGSELKIHLNKIRKQVRPDYEDPVYIRFFNGRVLKHFLPFFQAEGLASFYGPVSNFAFMNDLGTEWQIYSCINGKLEIQSKPVLECILFLGDDRLAYSNLNSKSMLIPEPEGFQPKLILVDDDKYTFSQALSKSTPDQLGEIFSDGVCYYTGQPEGTFQLFYLDEKRLLGSELISREMLEIQLKEDEEIREKNQKRYSDSITKPDKKTEILSDSVGAPPKSKIWSWLKI